VYEEGYSNLIQCLSDRWSLLILILEIHY